MQDQSGETGQKTPPRKRAAINEASLEALLRPASFAFLLVDKELADMYDLQLRNAYGVLHDNYRTTVLQHMRESIRIAVVAGVEHVMQLTQGTKAEIVRRSLVRHTNTTTAWFNGDNLPEADHLVLVPGSNDKYEGLNKNRLVWLVGLREGLWWLEQNAFGVNEDEPPRIHDVEMLIGDHTNICLKPELMDLDAAARWDALPKEMRRYLETRFDDCEEQFTEALRRWESPFRCLMLITKKHELRIG